MNKGHNWERVGKLSLQKIVSNLSNEELLKFNFACRVWFDAAREGKTPQESARIFTTIAHTKIKSLSKDMKI